MKEKKRTGPPPPPASTVFKTPNIHLASAKPVSSRPLTSPIYKLYRIDILLPTILLPHDRIRISIHAYPNTNIIIIPLLNQHIQIPIHSSRLFRRHPHLSKPLYTFFSLCRVKQRLEVGVVRVVRVIRVLMMVVMMKIMMRRRSRRP